MKQELQSFKDTLEELGIQYYESGVSLAVQHCPTCGRNKFKVIFRIVGVNSAPFMGRCQSGSCEQNYSSISYLMALGMDKGKALASHGMNPDQIVKDLADDCDNEDGNIVKILEHNEKEEENQSDTDISNFFNVESCIDSIESKYAIKRGYNPAFSDIIKIDILNNAVVFIVRDSESNVLGYQRRYVNPPNQKMKTKTSKGFAKTAKLLEFKKEHGMIVVCEGPFTALSAWHFGYHGVCTFGAGISIEQLEYINSINQYDEILVATENDDAGDKFFKKIYSYFYWKNINVGSIYGSQGDLNDLWMNHKTPTIDTSINYDPATPDISINF